MAEKFILHVEVLFATIDDLEYQFARLNLKGTCLHWAKRELHLLRKPPQACHMCAKLACSAERP